MLANSWNLIFQIQPCTDLRRTYLEDCIDLVHKNQVTELDHIIKSAFYLNQMQNNYLDFFLVAQKKKWIFLYIMSSTFHYTNCFVHGPQ